MFVFNGKSLIFPSTLIPSVSSDVVLINIVRNTIGSLQELMKTRFVGASSDEYKIIWDDISAEDVDITLLVEILGPTAKLISNNGDELPVALAFALGMYNYIKDQNVNVYALTNGFVGIIGREEDILRILNKGILGIESEISIELLPSSNVNAQTFNVRNVSSVHYDALSFRGAQINVNADEESVAQTYYYSVVANVVHRNVYAFIIASIVASSLLAAAFTIRKKKEGEKKKNEKVSP